jgi:hypothetical protein
VCAYVLVEQRHNRLPTPPSSTPSTPFRLTRAVASQRSFDDSVLDMPNQILGRDKQPHRWRYTERQTLCLTKRLFEADDATTAKLLNHLYPQGSSQPFRTLMVRSQYSELKFAVGPLEGRQAYGSIWAWPFERLVGTFAYRIAEIEIAAAHIDLLMCRRLYDNEKELRLAKRNRRREPGLFRRVTPEGTHQERESTPVSLAGDDVPQVKHEVVRAPLPSPIRANQLSEVGIQTPLSTPMSQLDVMEIDESFESPISTRKLTLSVPSLLAANDRSVNHF